MAYNSIRLTVGRNSQDLPEVPAGAVITPGEMLIRSGTDLIPHNVAADADPQLLVALEKPVPDERSALAHIDQTYAIGDTVVYAQALRGEVYNMFAEAAAVLVVGTALETNGAGHLQVRTTGAVVAFSEEAKTVGGSAERTRVRIA